MENGHVMNLSVVAVANFLVQFLFTHVLVCFHTASDKYVSISFDGDGSLTFFPLSTVTVPGQNGGGKVFPFLGQLVELFGMIKV